MGPLYALRVGTQVGLRAWPIGPTRAGWREIERQDRKVPGSRFRRHRPCSLSTPTSAGLSPASHQTQSSWGEPYFRETGPPHWAAPSRSKPPSGRLPVQSRAVPSPRPELLHGIPPGHTAATRDRTSPRVSPAPTPALYVGDVQGDAAPGRGDFTASPVPFPALEGVAAEAPPTPPSPPLPRPGRRALQRHAAANRHRGGGTAGGRQPPGRRERGVGARHRRRALGLGGGAAGVGGGVAEKQPEDHCSPRLRRTDAGPKPASLRPRPPA